MWNLIYSNPVCYKRRIAQEQLQHLNNIQNSRPLVNTRLPFQPTYSLSRMANKYTINYESDVAMKNNVLLNKMMEIQKRSSGLQKSYSISSIELTRKRKKAQIDGENRKILKRLQSAGSNYSHTYFKSEVLKNNKYRENLQSRTKTHDDFTILAQQELQKRVPTSQSTRKPTTSHGFRQYTIPV